MIGGGLVAMEGSSSRNAFACSIVALDGEGRSASDDKEELRGEGRQNPCSTALLGLEERSAVRRETGKVGTKKRN
ncbi:unnamed protein product [Linum trigynum]|uniref:Uncharacterized protein n=1 Tax=Linum trigynum TaxID=586398 RepID=A0AAV2FJK6_9ROSI